MQKLRIVLTVFALVILTLFSLAQRYEIEAKQSDETGVYRLDRWTGEVDYIAPEYSQKTMSVKYPFQED